MRNFVERMLLDAKGLLWHTCTYMDIIYSIIFNRIILIYIIIGVIIYNIIG